MPTASNLNWVTGETIANSVDGPARRRRHGRRSHNPFSSIHLIVDVDGWFDAALPNGGFTPVEPDQGPRHPHRPATKVGPGGDGHAPTCSAWVTSRPTASPPWP